MWHVLLFPDWGTGSQKRWNVVATSWQWCLISDRYTMVYHGARGMCSFVIDLCRICKNWRFDAVDTNWWDRIYKISCQEVLVFQIRSLLAYHIIHDIYIIQSIVIVIITCLLLLDYYQLVHIITIQLLKPRDVVRHAEISAWGRHHLSWGNLSAAKDAFETARSLGPAQDRSLMALLALVIGLV